jgi:hypothetical protein
MANNCAYAQLALGISRPYTKEGCWGAYAQLIMTILPGVRSPMPEYLEIESDRLSRNQRRLSKTAVRFIPLVLFVRITW